MSAILLDTHVAIWGAGGKLKGAVARTIDGAAARNELLLSPIIAWEIAMLARKARLELAMPAAAYVRSLFAQSGVVTATLTPDIAVSSTTLPGKFHADPADRILIATAAAYGAALLTRDRRILEFAKATKYIRCLAC